MSVFPCERYKPLAATVGNVAKFLRTCPHTSYTRQPSDRLTRILTPGVINCNCVGFLLFTSFSSCVVFFLHQVPPRVLRAHVKNPSPLILPVTISISPMASDNSDPSMA